MHIAVNLRPRHVSEPNMNPDGTNEIHGAGIQPDIQGAGEATTSKGDASTTRSLHCQTWRMRHLKGCQNLGQWKRDERKEKLRLQTTTNNTTKHSQRAQWPFKPTARSADERVCQSSSIWRASRPHKSVMASPKHAASPIMGSFFAQLLKVIRVY